MDLINDGIWINKEYKEKYNDASKSGTRSFYNKHFPMELKGEINSFLCYLRADYFFPIRCNIHFVYQRDFISCDRINNCNAIFFNGKEDEKIFPSIYISCKDTSIDDIIFNLVSSLTYYFQWYFFDDEKRSERSLKIEATKWAKYIINNYYNNIKH